LERINWAVEFSWVNARVVIYGNELADRLAKPAACDRDTSVSFNRIPKSTLYSEIEEVTQKWKKELENCTKAAITKQLFSNVREYKHKPEFHSYGNRTRENQG
jgi:hypothetical protein